MRHVRERCVVGAAAVAALCLATAVWVSAEQKKPEDARKRKLNELMRRPTQQYTQAECIFCHEDISPNIVKEFKTARDGEPTGTECVTCHGTNHEAIIRSKGAVRAEVCQECHPKQYEETMARDGHSRAMSAEWFQQVIQSSPGELMALSQFAGREVAHRCTSCHSRHKFSKDEAKDPRTCGVCHSGREHPETDAYLSSKHGVIWKVEGDTGRAPTCVTCHMLAGSHNVSGIVIYGSDPSAVKTSPFSRENKRKRGLQVTLCSQCHSERFAREQLEMGDRANASARAAFEEAVAVVTGLYDEGILTRPPSSAGAQGLPEIEQRLFRLDHFWRGFVWKRTVHGDLIGTVWDGWYRIQEELSAIRSEATRLRTLRSLEPPSKR